MTSPIVRTTRLAAAYRRYLASAHAPQFAAEVDQHYSPATLETMLDRGDIEVRRASALALGLLGDRTSIDAIGRSLSDSDRGVRMAADDSFRAMLIREAAPNHRQQLLKVMHLNDGGEYAAALAPALILVDQAPKFSEAYHQLAICWQGLENFFQAETAFRTCLWHCRFHYMAWHGLARCWVLDDQTDRGLMALKRCLAICPDVESARMQIRSIQRARRQFGK